MLFIGSILGSEGLWREYIFSLRLVGCDLNEVH